VTIGPVQVIVFGFERTDRFRGEIVAELANLRGRGLVRLVDLFVAIKEPSGELVMAEMDDLTGEEASEFGAVVGKLLGLGSDSPQESAELSVGQALDAASHAAGVDRADLQAIVRDLAPGTAVGVLMFEHTWAIPLRDAIRRAGGVPLVQGIVTPEALVLVGAEIAAMAEAERTIEVADIVKGAAVLDALAAVEAAEAVKTAAAADVLRTLVVADLIEEAAVQEAIETLAAAGLIEAEALATAEAAAEQAAAEDRAVFADQP
jgi:hypothetical protein